MPTSKPKPRRVAWKGWAMFRDGNPTCVYFVRKHAVQDREPGETIVPVLLVREVLPKKARKR